MKASTIVAYAVADDVHCGIFCTECAEAVDLSNPVFAGFEVDCPEHCEGCGEYIQSQQWTPVGVDYVVDALEAHAASGHGDAEVLDTWREELEVYRRDTASAWVASIRAMDRTVGLYDGFRHATRLIHGPSYSGDDADETKLAW